MSNAVRGRGVIDLRKRRAGAQVRAARARARAELPVHRKTSLRARRRKLRALAVLAALILAGGVVYGAGELSYLPRYSIDDVSVEGTASVPPKLVRAFVETKLNDGTYPIISRENIFLYPKAAIAKSISEYFPRILSAQISRASLLAQAITVTVVERKPFALWCSGTMKCFEMDNTGFVFATAASTSPGEVVFSGGLATSTAPLGQMFLPRQFAGVLTFLSRLRDQGFSPTGVSVDNEQDFSVSLAEGFVVRATFSADASALVRNLQTVLSSDSLNGQQSRAEYIDLRFGNRVYYKLRGGVATTTGAR